MKKRDSNPTVWASACAPRPRDSIRALATCVELTKLPGKIARGSTVPEKRNTSTFWLTPICFSPVTTRCPLGSTSTTVAVIDPVNVLALSVSPFPAKTLVDVVPRASLASGAAVRSGNAEIPAVNDEARLEVDEDYWLALTFSTI